MLRTPRCPVASSKPTGAAATWNPRSYSGTNDPDDSETAVSTTSGRRSIAITSNMFPLYISNRMVVRYEVRLWNSNGQEFPPRLIPEFLRQAEETFPELYEATMVFDGSRFVHCCQPLRQLRFEFPSHDAGRLFTLCLEQPILVDLGKLLLWKNSTRELPPPTMELQCVEAILAYRASRSCLQAGKSFYPLEPKKRELAVTSLGGSAELWTGHFQMVMPAQAGFMVNMDLCTAVMMEPVSVLAVLRKRFKLTDLSQLEFQKKSDLEKCLVGLKIEVTHRGKIKRKYRVVGIAGCSAAEDCFEAEPGSNVSVQDYFRTAYQLELQHPNLPCILCGSSKRTVSIPMECAKIVQGQTYSRPLDTSQRAKMLQSTCGNPKERQQAIQDVISMTNVGKDRYLRAYGLEVERKMARLEGHILPAPTLQYPSEHTPDEQVLVEPKNGVWMMRDVHLSKPVTIRNIGVAYITKERTANIGNMAMMEGFLRELVRTCRNKGIQLENVPTKVTLLSDTSNLEKALRSIPCPARPDLLLIFLPSDREYIYSDIKRISETVLGIPSQCIDASKLRDKRQTGLAYQVNLVLKINAKLGGYNHALTKKRFEGAPLGMDDAMVIGYDIQPHQSNSLAGARNLIAMVASYNQEVTTYHTSIREIRDKRADFFLLMNEMLKHYSENRGVLPRKLIVYRNAKTTLEQEKDIRFEPQDILDACNSFEPGYRPTITFIGVFRKNHIRDADKTGNMLSGTVADKTITRPDYMDFYLCSHAGLKGTSKPTHYLVLQDENRFSLEQLEFTTYQLCHLYARCTRAVSLPAPVYYAQLAIQRAKLYHQSVTGGCPSPTRSLMRRSPVQQMHLILQHQQQQQQQQQQHVKAGQGIPAVIEDIPESTTAVVAPKPIHPDAKSPPLSPFLTRRQLMQSTLSMDSSQSNESNVDLNSAYIRCDTVESLASGVLGMSAISSPFSLRRAPGSLSWISNASDRTDSSSAIAIPILGGWPWMSASGLASASQNPQQHQQQHDKPQQMNGRPPSISNSSVSSLYGGMAASFMTIANARSISGSVESLAGNVHHGSMSNASITSGSLPPPSVFLKQGSHWTQRSDTLPPVAPKKKVPGTDGFEDDSGSTSVPSSPWMQRKIGSKVIERPVPLHPSAFRSMSGPVFPSRVATPVRAVNSFCFTSIVPSDGLFYASNFSMESERIQSVKVTSPPVIISAPAPCSGEVSSAIKEIVDIDCPNLYVVHSALTGTLYYA